MSIGSGRLTLPSDSASEAVQDVGRPLMEGEQVIDNAILAAVFCLTKQCADSFTTLGLGQRIEVIFVFRAFFNKIIDRMLAYHMIHHLISIDDHFIEALSLAFRLMTTPLDMLLCRIEKMRNWRWSDEEEFALFASAIQGRLSDFVRISRRASLAIQQRLSYWRRVHKHILFFDIENITVTDEEEEEERGETDSKQSSGISALVISDPISPVFPYSNSLTLGQKNVAAALAGRRIKLERAKNVEYRMAACRAEKRAKSYRSQTNHTEQTDRSLPTASFPTNNALINKVLEFSKLQNKKGVTYPLDVRQFWVSLHALSPYTCHYLSKLLDGPCQRSITSWLSEVKRGLREELFQFDAVGKIASRWIQKWGHCSDDVFTLSFDACKLDEDLVIHDDGTVTGTLAPVVLQASPLDYKLNAKLYQALWEQQISGKNLITHAFVFMLTPVDERKGYPIHVVLTNTGSATDAVFRCIRELPSVLEGLGIRVVFKASDSDCKYRMSFNYQFDQIHRQLSTIWARRDETDEISGLESVMVPVIRYCNDIPHINKRWRRRLVSNERLVLSVEACHRQDMRNLTVNTDVMRSINPNIPDSAFRNNSLATMDDSYPLMIFTVDSLWGAWASQNWGAFCYLLPVVCSQVVFRAKTISREKRFEFAFLGWAFCHLYYSYLNSCTGLHYPIMTRELIVDMSNALLCQMCALCQVDKAYRTSKISSTISEHFFARIRRIMNQDQSVDSFVSALLRCVIFDLQDDETGTSMQVPRRTFDSATCERGISRLSTHAILEIRDFLAALFCIAGVHLPPNLEHVEVLLSAAPHNLENSSVIAMILTMKAVGIPRQRFTIHAGQVRLRRIYGRSIIARFTTAATAEKPAVIWPQERPGGDEHAGDSHSG